MIDCQSSPARSFLRQDDNLEREYCTHLLLDHSLLLKKDFYLANTEGMSAQHLPLYNWIYFGIRPDNGHHSIYTYGLRDFGKEEMEIVDSEKPLEELREMIFNLAHYVLAYHVILKDGETIGISATQKLKITASKGQFLEGETLKIAY